MLPRVMPRFSAAPALVAPRGDWKSGGRLSSEVLALSLAS